MTRTYSINEIERMRHAVHTLERGASPRDASLHLLAIEAHLQTYIFAGVGPGALETAARERDPSFNALPNLDQIRAWEAQRRSESTLQLSTPGISPDAPWLR